MKNLALFCILLFPVATILSAQETQYAQYEKLLLEKNDSVKCARLIRYGSKMNDSLSDYKFALLIFEKVNSLLKPKNESTLHLALYHKWAFTYYEKGNFQEADKLYAKALASKFIEADRGLKANILVQAGANLSALGVYKRTMTYYNEALEIFTGLNDEKNKAMVYYNMANVYLSLGNFDQADVFYDKALKIYLKNDISDRYLVVLGSKAVMKYQQGKFDEAKSLGIQSLKRNGKKDGHVGYDISNWFNLGLFYVDSKLWDSCFYYINRGKSIADSMNVSEQYDGTYYYAMGYCYVMKGEERKGISYYKRALGIKTNIQSIKSLYDDLSHRYAEIRQYDTALIYKNKSAALADSIYKSELKENSLFEKKRLELLEKDYQNQIKSTEQEQSVKDLKKRNYLLISLVIILFVLVLLFFLYFKQYKLKVRKEHLQSELDFLKAQLNPHFLFNSINNIYVLLDENKEKASEILLKFSDLLRYQLYECNVKTILLNKEVQFLENYIAFEMLRYSNKIRVTQNFQLDNSNQIHIAPLLLQPFIENAFKHTPKRRDALNTIDVFMRLNAKDLLLEVHNSYNEKLTSSLPGGIGLENVKKRLELLYPGKHELQVSRAGGLYKIKLKLTLSHD